MLYFKVEFHLNAKHCYLKYDMESHLLLSSVILSNLIKGPSIGPFPLFVGSYFIKNCVIST